MQPTKCAVRTSAPTDECQSADPGTLASGRRGGASTTALFGGALRYARYGFVKRHLMNKIAGGKPGSLGNGTSRDYVYTEWDGVTRFTEAFLADLTASARP